MHRFLSGHTPVLVLLTLLASCRAEPEFDVIISGGTVYDGSGTAPFMGDLGIRADSIAAVGDLSGRSADVHVDAQGRAKIGRAHV